jgi:hypothetical protein
MKEIKVFEDCIKGLVGKKLIAIGKNGCLYFEGGMAIEMGIENYEFSYEKKDLDPKNLMYYAPKMIKKEMEK